MDFDLIFSLTPSEVFLTSACIGFWQYEDIEDIVLRLFDYFGKNFMLEVQYHNVNLQKTINQKILQLASKDNIELIMGCDSHFIFPDQANERKSILEARGIVYENEDDWYMDYPDEQEAYRRFVEQNILSEKDILRAIENTNIFLEFDNIEFDTEIKLPTLYPDLSQEKKDNIFKQLLNEKWKEYSINIPKEEHHKYLNEIRKEANIVINTRMTDYFLLDYEIVKEAVANGGIITNTGRGSGVSFFINCLLGFTKIDRLKSPVLLYPERFMSETRILESKSLPDLDLNTGNPEVFAKAQAKILGENHAYPMIAFGKFKIKSGFKLYAKSQNLPFETANYITTQLEKYETDLKYADEDEKDLITPYDYIEEKYHDILRGAEKYTGIISDKKPHACGHLIYQGNIKEEIGLIKCKSESTKKEVITTVIDGAVAEKYKFLKNDLLKVDVALLIKKIYDRIGIEPHNVLELTEIVRNNPKIWDIYKNGLTMGVNQVEKESTTNKVMKYQPQNISELTAFIAGIRPSFKSMYHIFEARKPFQYNIPAFDSLIQTEEMPDSFVLYQEQMMATLQYAGFPVDETYDIIKAISKKKPEVVKPLKERFIEGFSKKSNIEMSQKVWQIIDDSVNYGFNASHAYSMALDSLYCAYLKSYYPYEFYEVMLNIYSNKNSGKDKVSKFRKEMEKFNIEDGKLKFGLDNRQFTADKENKSIHPSLQGVKFCSAKIAKELYKLGKNKYDSFLDLLIDFSQKSSIDTRQMSILIKLNYFMDYGKNQKLLKYYDLFNKLIDAKQLSTEKVDNLNLNPEIISNFSRLSDSGKTYLDFQATEFLKYMWDKISDVPLTTVDQIQAEIEFLGNAYAKFDDFYEDVIMVTSLDTKYSPKIQAYYLKDGAEANYKIKTKLFKNQMFNQWDIIKISRWQQEPRRRKTEEGWEDVPGQFEKWITQYHVITKYNGEG